MLDNARDLAHRLAAEAEVCASKVASRHGSTSGSGKQAQQQQAEMQPADPEGELESMAGQLLRMNTQAVLSCPGNTSQALEAFVMQQLPLLRSLATALLEYWRHPEAAEAGQLELAQAAAARSCAYLRCANLECEGGPAAGEGTGAKRCR